MRWIFFSPVIFILFGGIFFYTGLKLLKFIRYFFPQIKAVIFWIPFIVLCCIVILLIVFRSSFSFLRQFESLWITIFLYFFMLFALLVFTDIAGLFIFRAGKFPVKYILYSTGSALVLCIGLIIYGASNARLIETVNYNINIDASQAGNNFDSMRIVLLSDIHIGSSIGKNHIARVVNEINRAKPDMVCLAGDIFDGSIDKISDLNGVINEFKKIDAPLGVFACLGNHDVDRRSTDRIVSSLNEANIIVLQDEFYKITDGLFIVGRKDLRPIGFSAERKSASKLMAELPPDSGKFVIMMDHRPGQFAGIENLGVNILFSGHTHNGQIFPGTLLTHLIFKRAGAVSYGHWQGTTMHAVVTSGAGFWGTPIRIGTRSEIAVIQLTVNRENDSN